MITLIQAVRLLGLHDDDFVYFCCRPQDHCNDPCMSVAKMRKYLDMKAIHVHRIGTSHYIYTPEETLEFIVSSKDVQHISDMCRKEY